MEVGEGEAPEEGAAAAAASVRDGVGLEPAGLVEGLRAAADGDEFLDAVAGAAGFAPGPPAVRAAMGAGDALEGARAVAFRAGGVVDGSVAGLVYRARGGGFA